MEIYLFGIKNVNINLKQLSNDYKYMFEDGQWWLLLILSGGLGLMWGFTIIATFYWSNAWHGGIYMLSGLFTLIASAIYIYWVFIPIWVRLLLPLIINLLNIIIIPIALLQKVLDVISDYIIDRNLEGS